MAQPRAHSSRLGYDASSAPGRKHRLFVFDPVLPRLLLCICCALEQNATYSGTQKKTELGLDERLGEIVGRLDRASVEKDVKGCDDSLDEIYHWFRSQLEHMSSPIGDQSAKPLLRIARREALVRAYEATEDFFRNITRKDLGLKDDSSVRERLLRVRDYAVKDYASEMEALMSCGDEDEAIHAASVLAGLRNVRAEEFLLESLYAKDGSVRYRYFYPLLNFDTHRAFQVVVRFLSDPEETIRRKALEYIASFHLPVSEIEGVSEKLERVSASDPANENRLLALLALGRLWKSKDVERSVRYLKLCKDKDKASGFYAAQSCLSLAEALLDSGKPDQAMQVLDELRKNSEHYEDKVLFLKGIALSRLGRMKEARDSFQEFVSCFPEADPCSVKTARQFLTDRGSGKAGSRGSGNRSQ